MNPKVDAYLRRATKWQHELKTLRRILLDCHLTEELKWGKPCYTFQDSNVVVLLPLKPHCALLFCKGALLNHSSGLLIQPTENTQGARQIRLTSVQEIAEKEAILKGIIREAIEVEKAGLEIVYKKNTDLVFPEEFQNKLDRIPALKAAFSALTPGRQRAYYIYFSGAKQSKTRKARVEKCMPRILKGKGLDDE